MSDSNTANLNEKCDIEQQSNWLPGLLRAKDAGDTMAAVFRVGSEPTFVMATLGHSLFEPKWANPLATLLKYRCVCVKQFKQSG
jgi:hypothetical protein